MMRTNKRQSSSPLRAGPIYGDELEHNRIQLEHNLQHTDLSLHLSSHPESETDEAQQPKYESSVEYPRHNSGPEAFSINAFASFDADNFGADMDGHSQLHAWSYRTGDDEEGISPYGGESVSTAAHHASALTLSAGLRGHGGSRREVSLSGVEYDPDRPLGDMIAGVDSRFSMLDVDPSKSKSMHQAMSSIAFDPLVVDDTAELDHILRLGHAAVTSTLAARLRPESESSASDSESSTRSRRPKLSEALNRVASFSPKRPRNAQSPRTCAAPLPRHSPGAGPSTHSSHRSPPRNSFDVAYEEEIDVLTPKARSKRSAAPRPEVMIQPPTPSSTGSNFTKMARGLAKDIEAEQRSIWSQAVRSNVSADQKPLAQSTVHVRNQIGQCLEERSPFRDIGNASGHQGPSKHRKSTPRAAQVHLPDVTGLTSAVASPAKNGMGYHVYEVRRESSEAEARFLSVLSSIQSKLAHLESENSISRRRVRELEHELEACKAEVARERSRVLDRESVIIQQREDSQIMSRKEQGKPRQKNGGFGDGVELEERYREVVEEKKALEALIVTLRAHLARLTSELSSYQELLSELRLLRDSDARTLRGKSEEVERLRDEVERLAGEIEVLRGVVEDGLSERRSVREASTQIDDLDEHEQEEDRRTEADNMPTVPDETQEMPLARPSGRHMDRTLRTDHATLGSLPSDGTSSGRFIDGEELDRISLELEERRSDRGGSMTGAQAECSSASTRSHRSPSPSTVMSESPARSEASELQDVEPPVRPSAPTPGQASRRSSRSHPKPPAADVSVPFPQIRGGNLERLFFSAPDHNNKTCAVCHRRARPSRSAWNLKEPLRHRTFRADDEEDGDEGFVEGPELNRQAGYRSQPPTLPHDFAKWRDHADSEGLPPQTVLARVLRELEDDFTHYKSIYTELAEQYGLMDAAANVTKRNVLAEHLREVINILEQKGDQIASLYDLLSFKDKHIAQSVVPDKHQGHRAHAESSKADCHSHHKRATFT